MNAKPNNCWSWHDIINTHCNVVVLLLYFVINNFFQVSNIFIGLPQTYRPWLLCPNHWWGEWFCPVPMCMQWLKCVWPFWTPPGSSVHGIFPARIMALKHVYYHVRNEVPVYVRYRIQDAWGWCMGMIQRWYGVGGGRGVQDWELIYTRGGFMSMYGKTNTVL